MAVEVRSLVEALVRCGDGRECRRLHAIAAECGEESNRFVATTLAVVYARCSRLDDARRVFDSMPQCCSNPAPWTAMMLGHARAGHGYLALELFQAMLEQGCRPDSRALVAVIRACATLACKAKAKSKMIELLEKAMAIHAYWLEVDAGNVFVATGLVDLYAKCGDMEDARRVFDAMPPASRSVVSWTALISGYADNGDAAAALEAFELMLAASGVGPNELTFAAAIKACCSNLPCLLEAGMAIHSLARARRCDDHAGVAANLVKLYASCGGVWEAYRAHCRCFTPASWTALVHGCAASGHWQLALDFFVEPILADPHRVVPGAIVVAALLACTSLAAQEQSTNLSNKVGGGGGDEALKVLSLERGMAIHAAAAAGRLERDIYVDNALIGLYSKCGSLDDALAVYHQMRVRDSVTLTCILLGCIEKSRGEIAMQIFRDRDRTRPENVQSLVAALKACGSVGALKAGKSIHGELCRLGWDVEASSPALTTCLVSFYSGCGGSGMVDAQLVFDAAGARPRLITWNALVAGYGRQGEPRRGLEIFRSMVEHGVLPDDTTFMSLLAACNHAGLVDECNQLWNEMVSSFRIRPRLEHYQCTADALDRVKFESLYHSHKIVHSR